MMGSSIDGGHGEVLDQPWFGDEGDHPACCTVQPRDVESQPRAILTPDGDPNRSLVTI